MVKQVGVFSAVILGLFLVAAIGASVEAQEYYCTWDRPEDCLPKATVECQIYTICFEEGPCDSCYPLCRPLHELVEYFCSIAAGPIFNNECEAAIQDWLGCIENCPFRCCLNECAGMKCYCEGEWIPTGDPDLQPVPYGGAS